MKVSVVISAFNEEKRIEECLRSVRRIASEIIVIDSSSTDKTSEIASKYTERVYKKENNLMLNHNKNFGFTKATSSWILSLDADERVEVDLADEILQLSDSTTFNGFYIPRKNIIFNKWIKHTGWYPDNQLRLFRRNKGRFEEAHVHEMLTIDGEVSNLKGHIYHLNYDSISHFLNKTISIYTISEANSKIEKGYNFDKNDIYRMPVSEFVSRFFVNKGYKDGMHGLVLSLLMAFYHFVIFLRLWEINSYKEENDTISLLKESRKFTKREINHWQLSEEIESERGLVKKNILSIKRKLNI